MSGVIIGAALGHNRTFMHRLLYTFKWTRMQNLSSCVRASRDEIVIKSSPLPDVLSLGVFGLLKLKSAGDATVFPSHLSSSAMTGMHTAV